MTIRRNKKNPVGRPRKAVPTPQEEKFIHLIMCGNDRKAAMRRAGYKENQVNGHKYNDLWNSPVIQSEITRRSNRMLKANEITEEKIIEEIAKIAFADLGEIVKVNERGVPYYDFTGKEHLIDSLVGALEVKETKEGRGEGATEVLQIKVSRQDKKDALKFLARIKGMDEKKVKHSMDEDLIERLNAGRSRVQQGEDGDDSPGGGGE